MKVQFNIVARDMKKLGYDSEPATMVQTYIPPGASRLTQNEQSDNEI